MEYQRKERRDAAAAKTTTTGEKKIHPNKQITMDKKDNLNVENFVDTLEERSEKKEYQAHNIS